VISIQDKFIGDSSSYKKKWLLWDLYYESLFPEKCFVDCMLF